MRGLLALALLAAAGGAFGIGIPLLALPVIALAASYWGVLPATFFVPKEQAVRFSYVAAGIAAIMTISGIYLIVGLALGEILVFQPYPVTGFDGIGLLVFSMWTAGAGVMVGMIVSVLLAFTKRGEFQQARA